MSLFEKKIVGIDFHDYSAELVEMSISKDKAILESYNREIIPPDVIKNGEIKKEKSTNYIESILYDGELSKKDEIAIANLEGEPIITKSLSSITEGLAIGNSFISFKFLLLFARRLPVLSNLGLLLYKLIPSHQTFSLDYCKTLLQLDNHYHKHCGR